MDTAGEVDPNSTSISWSDINMMPYDAPFMHLLFSHCGSLWGMKERIPSLFEITKLVEVWQAPLPSREFATK